ncbi:hypothetical protein [Xanthobacter flavus]|uniref:hypothetical protein n=1 Tax=Xanthobacter flavus TaxID=281 RepID=UPI001AE9A21A|nr:hypothetical protein [Xanthobacter flavus]MBP2149976.1 hypothetical protein [Xanthobacter flavus]
MAFDVPTFFIPVQPNQGAQIASYADRLLGAYDQGQASRRQQDVLDGRKALGAEMAANPTATPNYQSMAARLMGNGDLEGARVYQGLGQQATQNDFERQKIDILRQRAGKAEQPTYGLNPVWGVDANGNPAIMQLGKDGNPIQPKLPAGFTVAKDPIKVDAGTHFVLLDPQTRQPITTIPKNVAGVAQQSAVGKAAGEAQAQLPGAEGMAGQIAKQIDDLAADPYLPSMLGPLASSLPNVSADAARVQARMDQLKGGVFLQGYNMLKGGGAITEVEGLKAENAMARLNAAQNLQDYRAALGEFKDALTTGLAKLRAQGAMVPGGQQGQAAPSSPSTASPAAGDPLAQARAAIARGAPRDAVIQRLQQMGVNPAGL